MKVQMKWNEIIGTVKEPEQGGIGHVIIDQQLLLVREIVSPQTNNIGMSLPS